MPVSTFTTMSLWRRTVALLALAALLAALVAGCGGVSSAKKPVCEGKPQRLVIVGMTTPSDLESSKKLAGPVTDQAIAKAVKSCGSVTVGVVDESAENLALYSKTLTPKKKTAINPKPQRTQMTDIAETFVKEHYLDPLNRQNKPTKGSPFFSVSAKIRQELAAKGIHATAVVITGDGVFVDVTPTGKKVDARAANVSDAALDEFVPLLKGLPKCMMLIGDARGSGLDLNKLRRTSQQFVATFAKAGVTVQPTSSSELTICGGS
jgi:hypothetical protein